MVVFFLSHQESGFSENSTKVFLTTCMAVTWVLTGIFGNLTFGKDAVFDDGSNGVGGFYKIQLKTDFRGQTRVFLTTWVD